MTEWVVRRWARYGHERLYAETPGGVALGYLDVKTGRLHGEDLATRPLLEMAINQHLAGRPTTTTKLEQAETPRVAQPEKPRPPQAEKPRPGHATAAAPAWVDIGGVAPGSAARERAIAARAAQGKVGGFFARLFDLKTEERAWRVGAQGEQAVAEQLAWLGPEWRTLHAVRVGRRGSDIDHVLIGPSGVFTVNAKHHPNASIWVGGNTFMVNGQRVPYIRNSRYEARRAGRLLTEQAGFPVVAIGVIAVMGARRGFKVKKQPEDGAVVVVARRRVTRYLRNLPVRLTAGEIDAIYQVARRSTTWQPS